MIGDQECLFQTLNSFPQPLQILVVCGHNEKLQRKMREESASCRHPVLIEGFTKHIHEFMAVSHLIITKPGGVTTSEAIAMELPMLLYHPLPGQEEDNAKFLVQEGVAILGGDCSELRTCLSLMLDNPHILEGMKQKAHTLKTKEAASRALQVIVQTMYEDSDFTLMPKTLHPIYDLQPIY